MTHLTVNIAAGIILGKGLKITNAKLCIIEKVRVNREAGNGQGTEHRVMEQRVRKKERGKKKMSVYVWGGESFYAKC